MNIKFDSDKYADRGTVEVSENGVLIRSGCCGHSFWLSKAQLKQIYAAAFPPEPAPAYLPEKPFLHAVGQSASKKVKQYFCLECDFVTANAAARDFHSDMYNHDVQSRLVKEDFVHNGI